MKAAKEAAEAALNAVPEISRAYGVWTCGAAIGSDLYVSKKLKELEDKLCGTSTTEGTLVKTAKALADVDPHVAFTATNSSQQSRVDYVMSVHHPDETRSIAKRIDETLRKCYALSLGIDALDPNGHSPNQADPSFVHDLFTAKTRHGGAGYRPTEVRAQFLNTFNKVAPQFLKTEHTQGLWPSLESVLGAGSFNEENIGERWTAFYASDSRYATGLKSEWIRLQKIRNDAVADLGLTDIPDSILNDDAKSFGHGQVKMHKTIFDELSIFKSKLLTRRAKDLPRDDPRRMAYLASANDKCSNQLFVGTPTQECCFSAAEFRSASQSKLGLPQTRLKSLIGRTITNNANCPLTRVDQYGHSLKTVKGAQYDGIRRLHDNFVNLFSKLLGRSGIHHMGGVCGFKRTCKNLFSEHLNTLVGMDDSEIERFIQGIIPDLMIDATSLELSQEAAQTFGTNCTLTDVKTLAPGQTYSQSTSEMFSAAVAKRQSKVSKDYHNAARKLDQKLGTPPGVLGKVETEMNRYNSGEVVGLVVGAYAELSEHVHALIGLVADELTADYMQFFDLNHKQTKSVFLRQTRRICGLTAHRGWAKLLLDRCRDLVQHPNQPRSTRWNDEDDAEAHAHYHYTHPPGRSYRTRGRE